MTEKFPLVGNGEYWQRLTFRISRKNYIPFGNWCIIVLCRKFHNSPEYSQNIMNCLTAEAGSKF